MAQLAENQNNYTNSDDSEKLDELDEEEQNSTELEADQELYTAQSSAVELYNQGQEFRHPSYFKYFVLLAPLGFIVDSLDIFAHISGAGIPFGSLISFAATVVMLLIFWFTNTKQKRANEYIENIEKNIEVITQRIANAERNIVRVARLSRKVPGVKQVYRKLHLRTVRRGRVALRGVIKSSKSPILRYAAMGTLNLIPFLAILPWQLIGVYLSYRAEKEGYKNAQDASDSVLETVGETAVS
ncbi:MAG: hypothetical protein A2651_02840 [Candidatus Yanofskybacteria bacterium RIFCSPHIGHO2_01_FULL_42_12]|uniref:Uncharacterized protein n=1 Tax=Candidatus Yanofskybacteria bacterium RIFCSPLOWO2_01_FULL_42_49 TaxID=1802694 RepID=A0A1F8GCU3_9BACT|nr:MAG: hypothetical protein A2651_02840 [Candidatus Yanofskybacteria bacterium RIFCSPHIGHO2_01_FULL_42_12]OGN23184.1 MAG: hypothetical protein A2918_04085 [Candidatus Yanofskybacteria bacterium RIFCSPLOWO2_01_FULL_42_49]